MLILFFIAVAFGLHGKKYCEILSVGLNSFCRLAPLTAVLVVYLLLLVRNRTVEDIVVKILNGCCAFFEFRSRNQSGAEEQSVCFAFTLLHFICSFCLGSALLTTFQDVSAFRLGFDTSPRGCSLSSSTTLCACPLRDPRCASAVSLA